MLVLDCFASPASPRTTTSTIGRPAYREGNTGLQPTFGASFQSHLLGEEEIAGAKNGTPLNADPPTRRPADAADAADTLPTAPGS